MGKAKKSIPTSYRGHSRSFLDGEVAYWSSHLAEAKSELIVPGPHGSYALPETVTELKRILCLQLTCTSLPRTRLSRRRNLARQIARAWAVVHENLHRLVELLDLQRLLQNGDRVI